ncbi:MAG: hypothetical protein IPN90_05115 [Elusimicrobia bacterium]|nr:hypothetical protein [Elusimicrobiota bacterium]
MNTTSATHSHSRWARASYFFSVWAFVAALLVVALRLWGGAWASLLGSLVALPFAFWVIVRTSLYRHIYRGKPLAMLGFVVAFLGFSDAVGQLSYQALWRQAFRLGGPVAVFENKSEEWRIRYPGLWARYSLKEKDVTTFFFKPAATTPAIEFSISHRKGTETPDLDAAVRNFFLALPKSGSTQVLAQGPIHYPLFQHAYEVVYEDPDQPIVLRHRLIFLSGAEGLTVLSVTAVPSWYERLFADAERFLLSFEPLG